MDDPRLLARDSSHGYVDHPSRAMFAEPEAVPEEYANQQAAEGSS